MNREDIIDLGWQIDLIYKSPFTGKELDTFCLKVEYGFNNGTNWILASTDKGYEITSQSYSSYKTYNQNMEFNIKDISELKILMRQLGIVI